VIGGSRSWWRHGAHGVAVLGAGDAAVVAVSVAAGLRAWQCPSGCQVLSRRGRGRGGGPGRSGPAAATGPPGPKPCAVMAACAAAATALSASCSGQLGPAPRHHRRAGPTPYPESRTQNDRDGSHQVIRRPVIAPQSAQNIHSGMSGTITSVDCQSAQNGGPARARRRRTPITQRDLASSEPMPQRFAGSDLTRSV
jgi:hypothetical protein